MQTSSLDSLNSYQALILFILEIHFKSLLILQNKFVKHSLLFFLLVCINYFFYIVSSSFEPFLYECHRNSYYCYLRYWYFLLYLDDYPHFQLPTLETYHDIQSSLLLFGTTGYHHLLPLCSAFLGQTKSSHLYCKGHMFIHGFYLGCWKYHCKELPNL